MPLFDLECTECNYEEQDVPIKLTELESWAKECPKCQGDMVRKIGNKGGFRLKGSCWSRDGYSTHVGDDPRFKHDGGYNGLHTDEV